MENVEFMLICCFVTVTGALLKWVQGVVKYNSLMIAKVKPLHDKLEETSSAIGNCSLNQGIISQTVYCNKYFVVGAQHRLRQLESKKEALESRLRDLAEGFEQATVDKNEQENKRIEMQEHMQEAAYYRQVFAEERERRLTVAEAYHVYLRRIVYTDSAQANMTMIFVPKYY